MEGSKPRATVENTKIAESELNDTTQSRIPQVAHQSSNVRKVHYKKVKNYKVFIDKLLGKGAFSNVYLGENADTGQVVAVKEIPNEILLRKLGGNGTEGLERELRICQILKHKNIVRYYDFIKTENNNYFIFEYCGGGDLRSYLKEKRRLEELAVQRFAKQIADALKQLYQSNIIHRDLKLQNILLSDKTDQALIKLADFGLARSYEGENDLFETQVGTPIYMAPEIQKGQKYCDNADLWSVGIILFEMLAGFPPFMGRNRMELRQNIEKGQYKLPPDVKASPLCMDLILKLLIADPQKRINWADFFNHPFVTCDEKTYQLFIENLKEEPSDKGGAAKIGKIEDNSIKQPNQEHSKKIIDEEIKKEFEDISEPKDDDVIFEISPSQEDTSDPKFKQITKQQTEAPQQQQPQMQRLMSNNSSSLTQEDLEETLDEVLTVIGLVLQRCKSAQELIKSEVKSRLTHEPYQYDKECKYIVYRLVLELKSIICLFGRTEIVGSKDGLSQKIEQLNSKNKYEKQGRSDGQQQEESQLNEYSLRLFTNQPKEIKFTSFFLQKLSDRGSDLIPKYLSECMDLFMDLSSFIMEFGYLSAELNITTLSKDIMQYAHELSKEAALQESLYDYECASSKYRSAIFVVEELLRELYHSLRFSNEDASSSVDRIHEEHQIKNKPHKLDMVDGQRKEEEHGKKIKSFTFEKSHMKLQFWRNDEFMLNEVLKMVQQRLDVVNRNIINSDILIV